MKTIPSLLVLLAAGLVQGAALHARAQELPKKQPNLLTIIREQVKPGHNAAHARNEQGWPTALEKAKHPYFYLALSSISGPNEAWYIIPYQSHEKMGDDFKRADDDPVLSAEIDRLSTDDGEHLTGTSTVHALARPDLSYGDFPDLAQMRFYEVTTYTVRPGRESDFEKVAQAYIAARKRAGIKTGWRAYQAIAGLPAPSYLVIGSVKALGDLDQFSSDHGATMKASTAEEGELMQKGMRETVIREETNRFRVEPKQSYIPAETRNQAPDFWLKK